MAKLNINGTIRDVEAEADTPLLWVIREQVGLTGTKYGCGVAQCGACSVHINGEVQRSCSIRLADVKPTDRIVTIEGLSATASHPVPTIWRREVAASGAGMGVWLGVAVAPGSSVPASARWRRRWGSGP